MKDVLEVMNFMKEVGSNLGIVYHVDVTFANGHMRRNTYYNADNAKDAVRYFKNKYGFKCEINFWIEYV